MPNRKESVWSLQDAHHESMGWIKYYAHRSDVVLTFTSRGIEVNGYYDHHMVSIGPTTLIPWSEIDQRRDEVCRRCPKGPWGESQQNTER